MLLVFSGSVPIWSSGSTARPSTPPARRHEAYTSWQVLALERERPVAPTRTPSSCGERSPGKWLARTAEKLSECNVVFADPDNGLCLDEGFSYMRTCPGQCPFGKSGSWFASLPVE